MMERNKDSMADGKGLRPVFYIYQSLLSIYESWKLTSYYSSVESQFAGPPQFRVWKTCLSTKQPPSLDERRTGQRDRRAYTDENLTSSKSVFSSSACPVWCIRGHHTGLLTYWDSCFGSGQMFPGIQTSQQFLIWLRCRNIPQYDTVKKNLCSLIC